MKEAIFIDSWRKLGKKSRKRFMFFVASPYFNKNSDLKMAIHFIEACQKLHDVASLKKDLFKHLFPLQKYSVSKVSYILSDLTSLLKKFMLIEFDSRPTIQQQLDLCKVAGNQKMEKLFNRTWNNLSRLIEKPSFQDANNQFFTYKYHLEAQELQTSKSRKGYLFLPKAIHSLEAYFVSERLRLACLAIGSHTNEKLSHSILTTHIERVEAGNFDQSPAVIIYYYAYKMLLEKDEAFYFKFSKELEKNWSLFRLDEVEDIYLLGINFCVGKSNSGNKDFTVHAFELYRSGLSNKVFMKDGYLSIYNYKNILRLGLSIKAFEWTEAFLHEFKSFLPKEEIENTYTYNLAFFYFHKGEFDKSMELLRKVHFKDTYNNLESRRMLLRIYYELEEWSALDSHLNNFQSYVIRQKNIGYHKAANLNLVKITRLMMNKFPLSSKSKQQIKKRIQNANFLADKNWIIKAGKLE